MQYYVGLDVSLKQTSICVVDHTKVYCGRSEEVMRPHARVMEEPTQIADCVTQQRRCSGLRSVQTSIAHGRCIMRNHDLVPMGYSR
jgi:hypothetical protein